MDENLRSILLGLSALYVIAGIALILTILRHEVKQQHPAAALNRFTHLFLVGVAFQCLHFIEEFVTGFHIRFPAFLGLAPWPAEFFVTFNLAWIAIWIISAIGIYYYFQAAYFPVWFFILGMIGNGVFHPLLALATQEYFPGLVTSPIVGVMGILLFTKLWELTRPRTSAINEPIHPQSY